MSDIYSRPKLLRASDFKGLSWLLVSRMSLTFGLILLAMLVLFLSRDGLYDPVDGFVSISDIAYFTMTTLLTVGYGDIVPISNTARVIDTFIMTGIRLGIWLVLSVTAYELLFTKSMEGLRMAALKRKLKNHVIVCGLGELGVNIIHGVLEHPEMVDQILGIDIDKIRAQGVADDDIPALHADATKENTLRKASIEKANILYAVTGRDDTNILICLTAKHLNPRLNIIARASEEENIELLKKSGADTVVNPPQMVSKLMVEPALEKRPKA